MFVYAWCIMSTLLILWCKLDGNTINTVPFICWCWETLAFEYMTQVATTSSTGYLNTTPIWIRSPIDSSRKTFIKCRPPTTRIKFCCRFVQWRATTSTTVYSIFKIFVVFSSPWKLSALLPQDSELFWRENSLPLLLWLLHSHYFWFWVWIGTSRSECQTQSVPAAGRRAYTKPTWWFGF